ncbi:MAG: hypothetical protein WCA12_12860 [Burkholderiales bacterium]
MIEALRKVIKRLHYPIEVMLVCVRSRIVVGVAKARHFDDQRGESVGTMLSRLQENKRVDARATVSQ